MSVDSKTFKEALSLWASGVTVITYSGNLGKGGLTVSSFSSVSLDPPLVSFCLAKSSNAKSVLEKSKKFAINILSNSQKQISADFASTQDKAKVLESQNLLTGATGVPLINGCLANLDCEVFQVLDVGDHFIYIGLVVWAKCEPGTPPLLYFNKSYHSIG